MRFQDYLILSRKVKSRKTILSILILSLTERVSKLESLIVDLNNQIVKYEKKTGLLVELIVDLDNGKRTISSKRNHLLRLAKGDFLCFIDDDDRVSSDFISILGAAIEENANVDCISFDQNCCVDGRNFTVSFGIGNPLTAERQMTLDSVTKLLRPPHHMCPFKSDIAKNFKFEDAVDNRGKSVEDIHWLLRIYPHIIREYRINKTLHYYEYNSKLSRS